MAKEGTPDSETLAIDPGCLLLEPSPEECVSLVDVSEGAFRRQTGLTEGGDVSILPLEVSCKKSGAPVWTVGTGRILGVHQGVYIPGCYPQVL